MALFCIEIQINCHVERTNGKRKEKIGKDRQYIIPKKKRINRGFGRHSKKI
jgi:hypothetical protein